jgi:hypothetical protein
MIHILVNSREVSMRHIVVPFIVILLVHAAVHAQSGGALLDQSRPLRDYLKPDGSLGIPPGFSGSLNPSGWRMKTGPHGEPRFVPEGASNVSSDADTAWDNHFGLLDLNSDAMAMAVSPNGSGGVDVYVGGTFSRAGMPLAIGGGAPANYIIKWDGTGWSTLGGGMDLYVYALAVSPNGSGGTDVYAGGEFTMAGDTNASKIARWDGVRWSPLGLGVNSWVNAIAVVPNGIGGAYVYAGGHFTSAGGVAADHIARWDGSNWSAVGAGLSGGDVYALATKDTSLYAGGGFTSSGLLDLRHIAKWDGGNWSPLNLGVDGIVYAIAPIGNGVYVGGGFDSASGVSANHVAR